MPAVGATAGGGGVGIGADEDLLTHAQLDSRAAVELLGGREQRRQPGELRHNAARDRVDLAHAVARLRQGRQHRVHVGAHSSGQRGVEHPRQHGETPVHQLGVVRAPVAVDRIHGVQRGHHLDGRPGWLQRC